MNDEPKIREFSFTIAFIVCFIIGCMFLYWAVEYWVYNSFDSNRYELSKIQVGNSDSLSIWKLDKRTGGLEYCTKSYDKMDHFVCVRASTLEAKEYSETPEPLKTSSISAASETATKVSAAPPVASVPATTPATDQPAAATPPADAAAATAPATDLTAATTPADAVTMTSPADATIPATVAATTPAHKSKKKKTTTQ